MSFEDAFAARRLLTVFTVTCLALGVGACAGPESDGYELSAEREESSRFAGPDFATDPSAEATLEVPAGTLVPVRFLDGVSSRESEPGEAVRAEVVEDVTVGGRLVLPAGAVAIGRVDGLAARRQGDLRVEFLSVALPSGESVPFAATVTGEAGGRGEAVAGAVGTTLARGRRAGDIPEGAVVRLVPGSTVAAG